MPAGVYRVEVHLDWRLLVLFTVVSWGGYNVMLKAVAGRITWQASMLCFVVGYVAIVTVFLIANSTRSELKLMQAVSMWPLAAGLLCGVGAVAFFKAVPMAKGSVLMPLVGLYVLVSALGCIFALHEPVTPRIIVGIICATAAAVLLGG